MEQMEPKKESAGNLPLPDWLSILFPVSIVLFFLKQEKLPSMSRLQKEIRVPLKAGQFTLNEQIAERSLEEIRVPFEAGKR